MKHKGLVVRENISLKDYTTFGIGGPARYFIEAHAITELADAMAFARARKLPVFFLGGGSNVLVSDDGFDGVLIRPLFEEFSVVSKDDQSVTIRVGAGVPWDNIAQKAADAGWWGIENMSFVPGTVGGAIIQNAGAYGQEISDVIKSVDAYDMQNDAAITFSKDMCKFDYRKSTFSSQRGRYVICSVQLSLRKKGMPVMSYPDVKKYLEDAGIKKPTLMRMREAVTAIRIRKGFNPKEYKSAGSFFKNPVLSPEQYADALRRIGAVFGADAAERMDELKNKFSRGGEIKVPAGFFMDTLLHLKNMRVGDAQLSDKQVISIINLGNATARDVLELYAKVRDLVLAKTGITLTHEPEFLGISDI